MSYIEMAHNEVIQNWAQLAVALLLVNKSWFLGTRSVIEQVLLRWKGHMNDIPKLHWDNWTLWSPRTPFIIHPTFQQPKKYNSEGVFKSELVSTDIEVLSIWNPMLESIVKKLLVKSGWHLLFIILMPNVIPWI